MSNFFKNTDLNLNRVERIVSETLSNCDDGELYLEDSKSESIVLDDNKIKYEFPISTSFNGTGCQVDSYKTQFLAKYGALGSYF